MKMAWTWCAACALLLLTAPGCGGETLESRWAEAAPKLDGRLEDWNGALTSADDGRLSVGFRNDAKHLYLAFSTSDQRLAMRVLRRGLTVWLDPDGGRKHAMGVRFPIGAGLPQGGAGEQPGEWRSAREGDEDRGGRAPGPPAPEEIAAMVDRASYELDWIEGDATRRLGVDDAASRYGIDAALRMEQGVFACEIALPLSRGDHMMAGLGVPVGKAIGITLDSPGMEGRGGRGGGGGFGGRGGPPGGMGGRGGGPPGGGPPGGRAAMAQPIDAHFTVRTAAAP